MNGPEDGATGDGSGPDAEDGSGDDAGGFEFGPERHPVSDERDGADADRTPTDEGEDERIAVDLTDDEPATPSGADPGTEPTASSSAPGPEPDSGVVRTWSILLVTLALASFATAAVVAARGDVTAAGGAGALGLAFGAVGAAARAGHARLVAVLAAGWDEHRRSVWFATGLFAIGTVGGIALLLAGYDLLEMIAELLEEGLFPELEDETGTFEPTATFFVLNNSRVFVMAIVGALTVGLLTVFVMVFNGVLIGNIGASIGESVGVDFILVGLAPHGIFELPALFIAAGVGFRIVYRFGERVFGSRDAFFTKAYVARTAALIGFGWLLLVLAAFVEAYVTTTLLEVLFADRVAGTGGTTPFP